jgi:hypothetical protein
MKVPFQTGKSIIEPSNRQWKCASPNNIYFNTKSFNIGTIKSKVVFVAPINHKPQNIAASKVQEYNQVCTSEVLMQ